MANQSKIIPVISLCLGGLLSSGAVLADDVDETEGERCISLTRLDRTHVIDDQQILFYMRGKDIYLNRLPRRCGGLASQGRFSYKTSMSQLCRTDMITVLQSGGPGLMRGATCGLGRFIPITEEEAEALRNPDSVTPEAEDLPSADPEEVGETG